jgi:hypothetical protein
MSWKSRRVFGLALCMIGGTALAQSPTNTSPYSPRTTPNVPVIRIQSATAKSDAAPVETAPAAPAIIRVQATTPQIETPPSGVIPSVPDAGTPNGTPNGTGDATAPGSSPSAPEGLGQTNPEEPTEAATGLGPTPLPNVNIIQDFLFGPDNKNAPFIVRGWLESDYTYRSTGSGRNNVAPVMNRFGDEALLRQLGLWIYKPLDAKELSWGFNIINITGNDAAFLQPTLGGYRNTNPRFGNSFTDLNLTAHLPILTEGGVDIKAGRQTTVLGPMGALSWQRPFASSDYAWYNLEEGRYTGVSATWHASKQLDIYAGIELGGWGAFFDDSIHRNDFIGQISYWLDEGKKTAKVWATVLTGPTGHFGPGNSTVVELGGLYNYNKYVYQIVDFQAVYSRQPVFGNGNGGPAPVGYIQRAYDVYTYVGVHLNATWDVTTRLEYYKDVDGGGYPGGFGRGKNDYYESTVGLNYHPTKWLEFRPEVRYDHATNPAFGSQYDRKNQLSAVANVLLKF